MVENLVGVVGEGGEGTNVIAKYLKKNGNNKDDESLYYAEVDATESEQNEKHTLPGKEAEKKSKKPKDVLPLEEDFKDY